MTNKDRVTANFHPRFGLPSNEKGSVSSAWQASVDDIVSISKFTSVLTRFQTSKMRKSSNCICVKTINENNRF